MPTRSPGRSRTAAAISTSRNGDRVVSTLDRILQRIMDMQDATPRILIKAGPTPSPFTLTLLRVGVGLTMMVHGWTKLADVSAWQAQVDALGIPVPEVSAWLAIAGELLGGAGLLVGLMTPIAALGVLATMLTAIFTVHVGNGLLASNNGYELPLTIALIATFFAARGAGPISLDALLERRRATMGTTTSAPSMPIGQAEPVPGQ